MVLALVLVMLLGLDVSQQFRFLSVFSTLLILVLYCILAYLSWKTIRIGPFNTGHFSLFLIVFFVAIPLATKLNLEFNLYRAKGNWKVLSQSALRRDADTIRKKFQDFLHSTIQLAEEVATNYSLQQALDDPNIENRASIFRTLSKVRPDFHGDYGIELFDVSGQSVAWAGLSFASHEFLKQQIFSEKASVSVVTGQVHTTLCIFEKMYNINNDRILGTVLVHRPLSINLPVQTTSLRRSSFVDDVSPEVRSTFRLDFISTRRDRTNSGHLLPSNNEDLSVTLPDFENNTLGVVRLSKPSYQGYILLQNNQAGRISILFLSLVIVFFLVKVLRILHASIRLEPDLKYKVLQTRPAVLLMMTLLLWSVRYAFLFLGFPQRLISLSIFDPINYASPFLGGLSRSSGDLAITLIFLTVNIYLGWKILLPPSHKTERSPFPTFLPVAAVIPGVLIVHFLFDAYIAGIQSLVHDSTLSFFSYLDFFSSTPLAILNINLILLSLNFLLFTLLILLLVERFLKGPVQADLLRWSWIFFAFLITALIWIAVTRHTFYFTERTILLFFTALLAIWANRKIIGMKTLRLTFILLVVTASSLISFPIFYREVMKDEDNIIRYRAAEALEPTESWIQFLVESSLNYFRDSPNIKESLLKEDMSILNNLAFVEWAKSPLKRLNFGSSVTILDKSGKNVSQFTIDIPVGFGQTAFEEIEEIEESGGTFLSVTKNRVDGKEVETYSGAVPVLHDENLLGAVILTIPVVKSPWGALARLKGVYPTLLRPLTPEQELIHTYGPTKVVVSTYERETLIESTDRDLLTGYRPSDEILSAIFDQKMEYVRTEEEISGKWFVNFYFPQKTGERVLGMVSVGYEQVDIFSIFHDFLRFFFTYILLVLLLYTLYRICGAAFQGDIGRIVSVKRFQNKLLISFAVLIIFPMLFMSFFGRNIILSQQEDWIRSRIQEDLTLARTLIEEETITAASELASNPEIQYFIDQPTDDEPEVLKYKQAAVTILDSEGKKLWSKNNEQTEYEIRARVRSTLLPRLFYSHSPQLAVGATVPVFGYNEESKHKGIIEYLRPIDDALCHRLSQRIGRDVNVYHKGIEIASTRPELFQSEVLSTKLPGDAFLDIELLGKKFYYAKRVMGEYPYIEGYQPLVDEFGRISGVLSIPTIYQQERLKQETAKTISVILVAYGLILSMTLLLGLVLSRRISSPVRELTKGTRRIAAGELNFRINMKAKDELGDLVFSFNKMTEDLRSSQEKVIQAEKDAAWREMARQVAHEVKNPLTPMKLSIQHLIQAYKDKAEDFDKILTETAKMVTDQIDVLRNIASEFSSFARLPKRKIQECDMNEIMQTSLRLFTESFKGIKLVTEYGDSIPSIQVDPEEMQRVFVNLIQNALQAMPNGGTLQIKTEYQIGKTEERNHPQIVIHIIDSGCGIPKEQKDKLFEPSFSTKTDGTGLGLAICKKVIDDLKGKIQIESNVGRGTIVTIVLPFRPLV